VILNNCSIIYRENLVVSLQLFKFTSWLAHLAKTNCAKPETL